jgi:hypothetical protein
MDCRHEFAFRKMVVMFDVGEKVNECISFASLEREVGIRFMLPG